MRRKPAIVTALLVGLLATGTVVAVRHGSSVQGAALSPAPTPSVPVVAGVVSSQDVPIYLRGVGTVIAYNTVLVRSQIQGQITKIAFNEGQTVHAGDLLAQIDPRPYQAQVDQVTATRDRDQAQLANAQANLGRYTQLGEKGWATPQLVETQTAQVAQLQSAIKADEALIEAANVQLGYTRLTSPIDGVTGVRHDGVVFHPGTDRQRPLETGAVGERTDVPHRSRKHVLDHLPVEQGGCGMGPFLQDLGDVGAKGFLVGRILGRGIWALLLLNDGVRQQLTGRSAENAF